MTFSLLKLQSISLSIGLGLSALSVQAQDTISLHDAIAIAQQNDPWLHGNKLKQKAIKHQSIAAATLPDPTVSVNLANIAADSWQFNQEAMTQLKIGVSQALPRGNVLTIKQAQLALDASQYPLMRDNRKAQLKAQVSQLWLDVYLAQQTITLIREDRTLFEQMVDIAKASYSSGLGKTRQQDVIRAQLELIQLDDRLTVQYQQLETAVAQLNEWLHLYQQYKTNYSMSFDEQPLVFNVSTQLPTIKLANAHLINRDQYSRSDVAQLLLNHPSVLAVDVKQQVAAKEVELAYQQYKTQWSVNASYGLRSRSPMGEDRADLFSVGVSFDLPLFTDNKQDQLVSASAAQSQAVKTDKLLLIKKMLSAVETNIKQLRRLSERQSLYEQQLLGQTHEQAESSLTAYTNDDGNFSEVVRARITELNARISALEIKVNVLKTVARINYYFTQSKSMNTAVRDEK